MIMRPPSAAALWTPRSTGSVPVSRPRVSRVGGYWLDEAAAPAQSFSAAELATNHSITDW